MPLSMGRRVGKAFSYKQHRSVLAMVATMETSNCCRSFISCQIGSHHIHFFYLPFRALSAFLIIWAAAQWPALGSLRIP